jgi:site-specific recombinase XerD
MHFRIMGKRDKIRFIPMHAMALRLIGEYLEELAKHGGGRRKKISTLPTSGL